MTCSYVLGQPEHPCGKPATAVWEHPVTGLAFLCSEHDRKALNACHLDPQLLVEWDRLPLAQSVTQPQGGPVAA